MQSAELTITGMDCPDCARTLEQGVARLSGVASCAVSFGAGRMQVTYDPQVTGEAAIVARVRDLRYDVAEEQAAPPEPAPAPEGWLARARAFYTFLASGRETRTALAGAQLLLLGMLLAASGLSHGIADILFTLALLIAGAPLAAGAVRALLLTRRVTIGLLMSIAAAGALIIGEPEEGAAVVILFAIGEALESFTMQRARDALSSLMRLAPAEALALRPCMDCAEHLGRDGYHGGACPWCAPHPQRVAAGTVAAGETILVRPGERVPLDGEISAGQSLISQQHITGESMPVARGVGDEIFAGSVNGDGALELRVLRPASEALLSRIANLVAQAQARRAPVERFMDRFAAIYTPAVIVAALLVASLPPLLLGQPLWDTADGRGWLYRALALLVIACPCALVISTPVSIVSALSAATRAGALIRGGAALEALRRVRVVAFDKTGTLTQGRPQVTSLHCSDHLSAPAPGCARCDDLLARAAALELRSAHPLAEAVVREAERRGLGGRYVAEEVRALPGRGVEGRIAGQPLAVGSHAYFEQSHTHDPAICQAVGAAEARGSTVMLVCACEGGGALGYMALADTLRPESRAVLGELRAAGISHTAMLTGDNGVVGRAVAEAAGIADVRHGLLPDQKLAAIEELARRYGPVAMVGDGANDTPALAAASVGIAMGAAGSDQALATADVALLDDSLARLPLLIRLSRRTHTIIVQNITASLLVKAAFLGLAMFGATSLWLAVLADSGIALLVILNGMRLLRSA